MSRHSNRVIESQIKKIDEIFRTHNDPHYVTIVDVKKDKNCDFHGKSPSRRGSVDIGGTKNLSRRGSMASNLESRRSYCSTDKLNAEKEKYQKSRNSIASFTELINRNIINDENGMYRNQMRRESMPVIDTNGKKNHSLDTWNSRLFKGMEHPSSFPNMLRSTNANGTKAAVDTTTRRASSNWNVNHFHNYASELNKTNLDRKQSMSTSEKIFKRDYTQSPEPRKGKELHSILKHNKKDQQQPEKIQTTAGDDELKEIIKRLSFDYIESEMSQNGNKMDIDLLSNSDSSSGGNGRILTSTKLTPRRISIDSLESSSRRSSRRFSDFSVNSDDLGTFKTRLNKAASLEVRLFV